MKLISCYVENFGCLQQYSLDFSPGLTVISQENGFGKTTLAEFLRAMFYGLPRKSKFLKKDLRTKYRPWQGGVFGGNLTFQEKGIRYRVERSFGTLPKEDKFSLYNLDLHKKSLDYSENLGEELFSLDSESFLKSAYLPQLQETGPLSTDAIQAKLTGLIEDSGDVMGYEKAIAALKARRSALVPYRGDGGTVAADQQQISSLQEKLRSEDSLRQQLQEGLLKDRSLSETIELKTSARERIRSQLLQASEAAARKALRSQQQSLREALSASISQEKELLSAYPKGLPTQEDLDTLDHLFASCPEALPEVSQEEAFLQTEGPRFREGLPTEADFRSRRQQISSFVSNQAALQKASMTAQEQAHLEDLKVFFSPGVPDLEALQNQCSDLQTLKAQQSLLTLSEEETRELEELQTRLHNLPPQALSHMENLSRQAQSLHQQASDLEAAPVPEIRSAPVFLLALIPGLLILGLGILFLTQAAYGLGAGALALGLVLLILSVYLKLRQTMKRELSLHRNDPKIQAFQAQARENEEKIDQFLSSYARDRSSRSQGLLSIHADLARLETLETRSAELHDRNSQIEKLYAELNSALAPYSDLTSDPAQAIRTLQEKCSLFSQLTRRALRDRQENQNLLQAQTQLTASLSEFFGTFGLSREPSQFEESLHTLQQLTNQFQACTQAVSASNQLRQQIQNAHASFESIVFRSGLTLSFDDRKALQKVRGDLQTLTALKPRIQDQKAALSAFDAAHGNELSAASQAETPDREGLRSAENLLTQEISQLNREKNALAPELQTLKQALDQIPALRDQLDHWLLKKEEDLQKVNLLDKTMDYLSRARDQLTGSYLGTLQSRFAHYMGLLSSEDPEQLSLSPDLNIQVRRLGQTRDLAYFSTGQEDLTLLAMRLSLVDTLFADTTPLLILDDPFVNLDDRHLHRALLLLQTLSRDHQILYLCCHSSRSL